MLSCWGHLSLHTFLGLVMAFSSYELPTYTTSCARNPLGFDSRSRSHPDLVPPVFGHTRKYLRLDDQHLTFKFSWV